MKSGMREWVVYGVSWVVVACLTAGVGHAGERVANGNFSGGAGGWTQWTERGTVNINFAFQGGDCPTGGSGNCARVDGVFFNGGFWQELSVVAGQTYTIAVLSKDWGTTAGWAEVHAGSASPANGVDYINNQRLKWDTLSCDNWNGNQNTACVQSAPAFVAAGNTVYLVLKNGQDGGPSPARVSWDNVSVDGPDPGGATNTPTNTVPPTTPTPTNTPGGACPLTECFETMPTFTTSFDAPWGNAANFAIVSGGQSGNYMRGSRTGEGSSARVQVFSVPANTNITISIYMRCPPSQNLYWMETGFRLGAFTAGNFDQSPANWTLVKKFDGFGQFDNGNFDTWTEYTAQVNTGEFTQISIGYKLGSSGGVSPTVGWDSLLISGGQPTFTPTSTLTPTHTPSTAPTSTPTNTAAGPDTDGDGVLDANEGLPPTAGQSNRWLRDSDGDGLTDGQEDANRDGALDAGETSTRDDDSDDDRYIDGLEVINGTSPLNAASPGTPYVDADSDLYPAQQDPDDNNRDVDGDRYLDGYERVHVGAAGVTNNSIKPPLGDLNLDAAVSNIDALIVQAIFLGNIDASHPVFQGTGFNNGDANRDGLFSNLDALVVQSFFLGNLNRLPL